MPNVAGMTSTNNSLNYLGGLHLFKKRPNALLKLLGALNADGTMTVGNGWRDVENYEFSTNVDYDLPAPAQNVALEGAAAGAASTSQNTQSKNVIQIVQETVEGTYLKDSTPGRYAGLNSDDGSSNPNGLESQKLRKLEKIAQDTNFSFLNGVYNNPVNPVAAALATKGLLVAVTTNKFANGAVLRPVSKLIIQNAYKAMLDNAGMQPSELICMVNTNQMAALNALYEPQFQNNSNLQTVAGVMVRQIMTAFGILNLVLDFDVPQSKIAFVNPDVLQGVSLPHPTKGNLFFEELAKTGSSTKGQFYGQIGLDHGPEWAHAIIEDLS